MNKPKTMLDYPDDTAGARLARENRAAANRLSEEERARHLSEALAKIYSGAKSGKTADRARH